MLASSLLGTLGNLIGPDLIIFAGLRILVIIGIVVFAVRLANRRKPPLSAPPLEGRLQKLEALHRAGTINGREYEEQRRRILAEL